MPVVDAEEPPRIHALPTLLQRAIDNVPDPDRQEIRDAAINLNAYYIPSRYPAEVGGPEGPICAEDAAEALSSTSRCANPDPSSSLPQPVVACLVAAVRERHAGQP